MDFIIIYSYYLLLFMDKINGNYYLTDFIFKKQQ